MTFGSVPRRDSGRALLAMETVARSIHGVAGLKSLRDAVMHPVLSVLGPQRSLAELAQIESGLRVVLGRTDAASR
jgi:hypothetical protein